MSCGADTTANTLLASLVGDKSFDLPDVDLSDDLFKIPDGTSDLFGEIDRLTNEDLTTRVVGGSGVFDALMDGMSKHLKVEYEQNRITGEQYTKAYISGVGGALQTGVSFLLGRDQAYWAAVQAQMQARLVEVQVVLARVNIETAKIQLAEAKMRALIAEAEYGLTKMKIATEDQQFCLLKEQTISAEYNNSNILPAQWDGMVLDNDTKTFNNNNILPAQLAGIVADNEAKDFTNDNILPAQLADITAGTDVKVAQEAQIVYETASILPAQLAGLVADNASKTYTNTNILPKQAEGLGMDNDAKSYNLTNILPLEKDQLTAQNEGIDLDNDTKTYTLGQIMPLQTAQLTLQNSGLDLDNDTKSFTLTQILPTQKTLLEEQVEVQRAQTMDTRTNGVEIKGSVGKQKDLYTQQITSYQRDAEVKAAKLFTDAWITQKTIDEGLLAPSAFRNDSVNVILRNIKTNNNIENDPGAQDGDPDPVP